MGKGADAIGIGLLGCGVVGTGILELLEANRATIEARLGAKLEVRKIAVRSQDKPRKFALPKGVLAAKGEDVVDDPQVDVVVEVIGGIEPAGALLRRAIELGKPVVTANKALLADPASDLVGQAERRGVDLYYEAAACGGIPIIRVLREALSSDRVVALRGIVNGTSNYVLSRMHDEGIDFAVALRAAQEAGYAEADPTLDVGGGDAAHKLVVLATLAFGMKIAPSHVLTEGIDRVSAQDIRVARRFGYVIKPLALARQEIDGLDLRVHPALVREKSVLASISGALNAVYVEGAMLGPCLLSGLGAGALPTAMSVVSDIVDVARNLRAGVRGRVPSAALSSERLAEPKLASGRRGAFYLRFDVQDRPGVLASIAGVLGAHGVSIHQLLQEGSGSSPPPSGRGQGGGMESIVMFTHEAREADVLAALAKIATSSDLVAPPHRLRIEPA